MIALHISGGATKITGLYGAVKCVYDNGINPDIITGVSAGSLLSLPVMLGKFSEIENILNNITLDTFFNEKPVNEKGKLTLGAKYRFITNKNYLGRQDNIIKLIKSVISTQDFYSFKEMNKDIYVGAVSFNTGKRKYFKLSELTYGEYIKSVMASSAIPVFIPPVRISGEDYYDGGVRDHIGTHWALDNIENITTCISIFSRPENIELDNWNIDGVTSVLSRHEEIRNMEISKNDEILSDFICKEKGIKHIKIFLPNIMKSLYDVDPERLKLLYHTGYNSAKNKLKNENI